MTARLPHPPRRCGIASFILFWPVLVYIALVQEADTPVVVTDERGLLKVPDAVLYSFDTFAPIMLVDGAESVMAYGYVVDDEPIPKDPGDWFPEGSGKYTFFCFVSYPIVLDHNYFCFCLPENPGSGRCESRFWVHIRLESIVSRWGNFNLEGRSCYTLGGNHINDTKYAFFFVCGCL